MVLRSLRKMGAEAARKNKGGPAPALTYESFVRGLSSGGLSEELIVDGFRVGGPWCQRSS